MPAVGCVGFIGPGWPTGLTTSQLNTSSAWPDTWVVHMGAGLVHSAQRGSPRLATRCGLVAYDPLWSITVIVLDAFVLGALANEHRRRPVTREGSPCRGCG